VWIITWCGPTKLLEKPSLSMTCTASPTSHYHGDHHYPSPTLPPMWQCVFCFNKYAGRADLQIDDFYWELLIDSLLQPRDRLHNPSLLETLKQTLEPLTVMQSPETGTLNINCATSILESPRTEAKLQPHSPVCCGLNTPHMVTSLPPSLTHTCTSSSLIHAHRGT